MVRPEAGLDSGVAAVFAGAADPAVPRSLPLHLLLLSRRLLQVVLGRPAGLRRRRAARSYWGEQSFPLILQNVHRYFMWIAVIFLFMLSYDVWLALWFTDPGDRRGTFGIGLGTIILAVNVVLLSCYTLGCHVDAAHRRRLRTMKCRSIRSAIARYACSSALNYRHQLFAWCSLFSVAFADLYIRLCSMGIWTDLRIL